MKKLIAGIIAGIVALSGAGAAHGGTFASAPASDNYYQVTGKAQVRYKAAAGTVHYCPLDGRKRPVCAYGQLTHSQYLREKAIKRGPITTDPTGWPKANPKVVIKAAPGLKNGKDYKGYMWNRSHMLADSLGGAASVQNMVPGTRTQNVGGVTTGKAAAGGVRSNTGGMAYTETEARAYLLKAPESCPLYYAATPQYTGSEPIPRTVNVDIRSCNGSIDQHVVVPNAAYGWGIDYMSGAVRKQ
jgi:DNA-entry nuclease